MSCANSGRATRECAPPCRRYAQAQYGRTQKNTDWEKERNAGLQFKFFSCAYRTKIMSLDKSSIFAFEQDSNIRALGLRRVFNEHLTGGKKAPWTYPDNVQTIGQKNTYRATHYKNGRVRRKKTKPTCPICLRNFTRSDNAFSLACVHKFHTTCICAWLKVRANCPLCQAEVSDTSFCPLPPFTGHTDWVMSVSFSPDGSRIVSGSDDNSVRVWDAVSGQQIL